MNFTSDRRVIGEAENSITVADDWLIEILYQNFSGIHSNDSNLTSTLVDADDDSLASGDDDDDPFWTKEQLILIENFPSNVFVVMGLIVSIIGILGLIANGMVLFIFSRFKRLRSPPANTFIINLAFSDMLASILHSMSAYSNFNGRWAFGRLGCKLYAMGITCFGLVSILTFSAIACERCLVIGLANSRFRVSRSQAKKACGFIWLHCAVLVSMPFFGWSSYLPEGLLTTCSWDYKTRTVSNRAYYILLLSAGFFLPLIVIFVSYGRIMTSVMSQARQMVCINSQNSVLRKLRRQTEIRTAQIVVSLILVYLTAWTPYAIVTLIGQFGPEDSQLSPMATAIPAYFAKTAVVLDPLVYGFSHPHFRASLRNYWANLANVAAHNNQKNSSICYNRDGIAMSHQHHQGGGMNSKSWPGRHGPNNRNSCGNSSYQSRGMTVYPTTSVCCRTLNQGDNKSNNQRRMLRTFRDLSVDSANNKSGGYQNRSPPLPPNNGQLEMSTGAASHSVAVVSVIAGAAETTNQPMVNMAADDSIIKTAAVNKFKYKLRKNVESESWTGPSTLSHIAVETQQAIISRK